MSDQISLEIDDEDDDYDSEIQNKFEQENSLSNLGTIMEDDSVKSSDESFLPNKTFDKKANDNERQATRSKIKNVMYKQEEFFSS